MDTKTFYLNSPLLEGDTIEDINGVATHVKRCKKIVFDGSEDWVWRTGFLAGECSNVNLRGVHLYGDIGNYKNYICSDFKYIGGVSEFESSVTDECIANYSGGDHFYMAVDKSLLSTDDLNGFISSVDNRDLSTAI